MSWDDTKGTSDQLTAAEWNAMVTDQKARIEKSNFTAAGSLLTSTGASAVAELTIGTDGQVLSVASDGTSLEWSGPSGDIVGTTDTQTLSNKTLSAPQVNIGSDAIGDIYVRGGAGVFTRLPLGSDGQVLTVDEGSAQPVWEDASGGASPLTTKGDIYTYTTTDARLPVGTDGQILSADSSEASGLKWIANSGGGGAGNTILTFSIDGELSTGTKAFYIVPDELDTLDVKEVRLASLSLPTGADIQVDVCKNGTATTDSIYTSDVPQEISTGESTTNGIYQTACGTSSRVGTPGTTLDAARDTVAADDVLYIIIRQVGSTVAGSDLRVQIAFG